MSNSIFSLSTQFSCGAPCTHENIQIHFVNSHANETKETAFLSKTYSKCCWEKIETYSLSIQMKFITLMYVYFMDASYLYIKTKQVDCILLELVIK